MAKDKKTVKDGKIIKSLNKGNFYDDIKKKYNVKKLKNADANKKAREKNYKNFNFENNPEFALSVLPAGKVLSKIPGVKKGVSKLGELAKTAFRGKTNTNQGQGGGKFNPPAVRPNKTISSKPNKPNAQIVKKRNTDIKKPNTSVVKKPNTSNVSNKPKSNIKTTGVNTRVAVPVLSSLIGKQVLAGGKNVEEKEKEPIKKIKEKEIKIKKSTTPKVKKETLKKMGPTKDYTGKFVNKKGDVAYDSIGDFFSNITGKAKKRARPENRKRIQADTKGATKGIGFSGKSVAEFKNPFKKNSGGALKSVPAGNTGLGKLPTPVRNKMGFMKKGGIVKMKGGGAATKGMNFNRGY